MKIILVNLKLNKQKSNKEERAAAAEARAYWDYSLRKLHLNLLQIGLIYNATPF